MTEPTWKHKLGRSIRKKKGVSHHFTFRSPWPIVIVYDGQRLLPLDFEHYDLALRQTLPRLWGRSLRSSCWRMQAGTRFRRWGTRREKGKPLSYICTKYFFPKSGDLFFYKFQIYLQSKLSEVTSTVSITGWPFVPGKMPEVQVILCIELMANMSSPSEALQFFPKWFLGNMTLVYDTRNMTTSCRTWVEGFGYRQNGNTTAKTEREIIAPKEGISEESGPRGPILTNFNTEQQGELSILSFFFHLCICVGMTCFIFREIPGKMP